MKSTILAGCLAAILAGCGGNETSSVGYSGIVQDGYIKGAKVCVDTNANGACDAGEPSTVSGADGKFTLQSSQANLPVVVYVGTDAVDSDTGPVMTPYTMIAPAGHTGIVNPLTTLVVAAMKAGNVDAATAESQVMAMLGVSDILGYDYVAQTDTIAHGVAQNVATLLGNVQTLVADSQTADIQLRAVIALNQQIENTLQAGNALTAVKVDKGAILAANPDPVANPRNAAAHPGDTVVKAGTGYHNTLFDSAETNCQNCHNDLYDTWKKSMHAQSWSDQVFQGQFQDFLRMSLSRIGTTGPTGIAYTEAKFKGAAQTCIKCHAPGAYYSGDFDVQTAVLSSNPLADYTSMKAANETNIAPAFDAQQIAKVVSLSSDGKVYQASYHIGNKHNREGINCAFCHSVETVRMMNSTDGDMGQYTLKNNLTAGPVGVTVRTAGETLLYSPFADNRDMNNFFVLIGPEKYVDPGNTPKLAADFNNFTTHNRAADGRFTMKSIPIGEYTGGPYYGPYGVTGLQNTRTDDTLDRSPLVKQSFVAAGRNQHMEDYGKGFCLSCHQRSAGALNPEYDGVAGADPATDQFMELCTTWSAMSNGVGDNYTSTADSPKCQSCHMERVSNKVVLHKWNQPTQLFAAADGVTSHFDPASGIGPVALNYLNNHAFMGANVKDLGTGKLKSGFAATLAASLNTGVVTVDTSLQNKTAHMFPGAHPMRRVLTRVIATDANGVKLNYTAATGASSYAEVVNNLVTLPGESIPAGRDAVTVAYNPARTISIPGMEADLTGAAVTSQKFDGSTLAWEASFGTVTNPQPVQQNNGTWKVEGSAGVNKIIASTDASNFTRIYGRETGKKDPANSATFVVRPGFDSNISRDNRLLPNEMEQYSVSFDAANAALPITVTYKVYYLAKGAAGKFPTAADGFLDSVVATEKQMGIHEVYSQTVQAQ